MNSLVNKIAKQKPLCIFFISFAIAYYVSANLFQMKML